MPVALPTTRATPTLDFATKTTLVYGRPKIGKSTFASNFPDALFFECEPGLNELSVFKIPIGSWSDLLAACKLVAAGDHAFKTIVIDTVDNAFSFCSAHVCAKHNIEYEGDLPHGKGWAFVKNEWNRVLTRLASLPYGLVLISHAIDRRIETRTGEYTKTQPSLPDRARHVVLGLVDMICFCDTHSHKDENGQLTVQRVIRSKPHPRYEAGDRTGRLPDTLPLDYAAFAVLRGRRACRHQLEHEGSKPMTDSVTPPHPDDAQASKNGSAFDGDAHAAPADLSAFDEDYDEVEAPSFGDLPDGKYQVRVERVVLGQSQNSDPMLKWDFLVLSGANAGRHLFKNAVITQKSLPFVKGDLEMLGVQLPKFSDLPNHLETLLDHTLEVTQRTKGEYTNLYLNRRITVPAGAAALNEHLDDEPAPF